MKKLSTLVLSVLTFTTIAQPTLTSNNAPTVGTSYIVKSADTTGIVPGPSGANKTWNFDLSFTSSPETASFIAAAGTPYAEDFPTANLAFESSYGSTTTYGYYLTNATEYSLVGLESNDSYKETYSDPQGLMHFPLNFNEVYEETFASTMTSQWGNGSSSGTITYTYDGYGTLTINGITYNNAIRLKEVADYSGSYTSTSYTGYSESYVWMPENGRIPVLSISNGSYTYSGGSPTYYKSVTLSEEEALGVNDITNTTFDFAITSLVAQGKNIIANVDASLNEVDIDIYDVMGRCVSKQQFDTGFNLEIQTADLAKGMYLVKVQAGNAIATKKITIQ